ncbi:MAG TPA: hypothetical protein VNO30_23380 [Kofleriaceae bacterium]|nr:hypothetical protein [Kofleriaceae bacterium]
MSNSEENPFGRKARLHRHALEVEAGREQSTAAPHVFDVGKRSLTEALAVEYSASAATELFERSLSGARAQLARLVGACAAADRLEAVTAAGMLRQNLRTAGAHASHGPDVGLAERQARLGELEARAEGALRDGHDAGLVPASLASRVMAATPAPATLAAPAAAAPMAMPAAPMAMPAATPAATVAPMLPPGADYQPIGDGGDMLIRVAWLAGDPAVNLAQPWIYAPTKWPHLLRALKAHALWWMPDAAFAEAGTLRIRGPIDPALEVLRTELLPEVFGLIGLPPGSLVEWRFEPDGGYEIISAAVLAHIQDLPGGDSRKLIPPAVAEQSKRRLYEQAGLPPPAIGRLASRTVEVQKRDAALVTRFAPDAMRAMLGPRWDELVAGPRTNQPPASSAFEGVFFDNAIPLEDRRYFVDWIRNVYGGVPNGVDAPADLAAMALLRRIDAHPLRDQLLARVRQTFPGGARIDWRRLERLIHEVEEEAARALHGLAKLPAGSARGDRYYDRPVSGEILGLGSLASAGKEIAFCFSSTDPHPFGFVHVAVRWIATPLGEPTKILHQGDTRHFAHHEPARWHVRFDKVGTYRITAFVDHESYWPAHFETLVEVKTEQARLGEVEATAFGDFGAQTSKTGRREFFEVSWTNDRLGDDKYTFGELTEGQVPAGFQRRSLAERLAPMAADRARLERLIQEYEGERRLAYDAKDIVRYARSALAALAATKQKIDDDARELVPFELRGAFLSERDGVRSGTLSLLGLVGRRPGATKTTVRIHDTSQLYEQRHAVYTGTDYHFREAIEDAFVDLCKAYPPGRVSVLFEQLSVDARPTGRTMGFTLHTGTAWKDAKAVLWNGKVQLAVNLAAAAAAVFAPGAAVVTISLVTAYNAVDTLDSLAELHRKGQAAWKDDFEAGLSIGLDLLPFLGRLTKAGKLGGAALFAIDVAQMATNVVVLTDRGVQQVRDLRNGLIRDIARLAEEIEHLRRVNDSDPRIAEKERQKAELIGKARRQAAETFTAMAASGAVMLFTPVAFNHLVNGAPTRAARALEAAGVLVHEPGVEPHYRPDTGRIHGDRARLDDAKLAALQSAYDADVYRRHTEIGQLLGAAPEQIAIVRKPGLSRTAMTKRPDGSWEITAPEGRPHGKLLDDIRGQRTPLKTAELRAEVDGRLARAKVTAAFRLEVLEPAEFARRFSSQQGRASILVHADGGVTIYARADASSHDVADEAIHLLQLGDASQPRLGESIRMLGEATVGRWTEMDLEMRKQLFERKLEVEIDAKTRRLAELGDADPQRQVLLEQLANLRALEAQSRAISPDELQLMQAAPAQAPPFLSDPAWLFAKRTSTTKGDDLSVSGVDSSKIKLKPVTDSPACKLGKVVQVGEPWTKVTIVSSSNTGTVKLDRTRPDRVMVDGRVYVIEDGAKLHVKDGQRVEEGTVLATEPPEIYRRVRLTLPDGTIHTREEYLSRKRGWVQAGEHTTRRSAITEQAARDQLTHELDAEKALVRDSTQSSKPDRLVDWMRIQHQNAQGQGFDDVIVEFRGDPPKARIRIIEVKDYPNRNVSLGEMSAIRENLNANMERLRREIREAVKAKTPVTRPAGYHHLTEAQLAALQQAMQNSDFTIELHLGPKTSIGTESRPDSILSKLRAELRASPELSGKDVLATGAPKHVDPKHIDAATRGSTGDRR